MCLGKGGLEVWQELYPLFYSWKQEKSRKKYIYMVSSNTEENKQQEKNKQLNEVHSTSIY